MFFFRHTKKRNSKPKSRRLGQIFPILLFCLLGLIGAVFVTKIVGDANINKTYASNAADSGSLSAASCWAGAFNRLIYRNWDQESKEAWLSGMGYVGNYMGYATGPFNTYYYYKEMKKYYIQMRDSYKLLYENGQRYLKGGPLPSDTADYYIQEAIKKAEEALGLIPTGAIGCSDTWDTSGAREANTAAKDFIEQAAYCLGAFYVCTAYMGEGDYGELKNGIASWFKRYQMENLCDAIAFMNDQYTRAIQTGQYYALSNSGYSSKLTNTQQDAFDFWLGGGTRGVFPVVGGNLSYPPVPTPGMCGIDVTVELPKIASYDIKMAEWNYPWPKLVPIPILCKDINAGTGEYQDFGWPPGPNLSDDPFNTKGAGYLTNLLFSEDNGIRAYFIRLNELLERIDTLTEEAAYCCECICNGWFGSCGGDCNCTQPNPPPAPPVCDHEGHRCDYVVKYNLAVKIRDKLLVQQQCIIDLLKRIKDDPAPNLSVQALYDWNDDIWEKLWPDPDAGGKIEIFPDLTCDLVKSYSDEHGCAIKEPPHLGMMVINIDKVTLDDESWEASCDVVSSCGGTSFSKSKFYGDPSGKGELVGIFNDIYYPEITEAR